MWHVTPTVRKLVDSHGGKISTDNRGKWYLLEERLNEKVKMVFGAVGYQFESWASSRLGWSIINMLSTIAKRACWPKIKGFCWILNAEWLILQLRAFFCKHSAWQEGSYCVTQSSRDNVFFRKYVKLCMLDLTQDVKSSQNVLRVCLFFLTP